MRVAIGIVPAIGIVAFALLMAWPFAASAQYCEPSNCANPYVYYPFDDGVRANAKQKKVAVKKVAVKKPKKPAKVQYMRIAP
jgi:hypothetical protein